MELLYLLGLLVVFGLGKLLYERYSGDSNGGDQASELANRLFTLQERWFSDPSQRRLLDQLAADLTDDNTDPIEQEFSALYFSATGVAIALTDSPLERQQAIAHQLSRLYGAVMAPGTPHSEDEWAEYYRGRAAYYERTAPNGRSPDSEDYRKLGEVFLEGVRNDPRFDEEHASPVGDETKKKLGRRFADCVHDAHTLLSEDQG